LLKSGHALSPVEEGFLNGLMWKRPTPKQEAWLSRIEGKHVASLRADDLAAKL
jgi:hypothetical protein